MDHFVSKSKFKPRTLEYFRQVEETGEEIIVTNHGQPVIKIIPYREEPDAALKSLRKSVLKYDRPFEPVALDEWDALK